VRPGEHRQAIRRDGAEGRARRDTCGRLHDRAACLGSTPGRGGRPDADLPLEGPIEGTREPPAGSAVLGSACTPHVRLRRARSLIY